MESYAAGPVAPIRMGVLYMANGVNPAAWTPEGDEHHFKLGSTMSPLESLKEQILILGNLRNLKSKGGDGHYVKTSGFLTSEEIVKTTGADLNSRGISMDQLAAAKVGATMKLASMELGTEPITTGIDTNVNYTRLYGSHIAWKTPTSPIPCEINPRAAFNRMFRSRSAAQQQNATQEKSVLDLVLNEAKSLRGKVGAADQRKLDEYLEGIRHLEQRIDRDAASLQAGENIDPKIFEYIKGVEGRIDKAMGPKAQVNDLGSMPRMDPTEHVRIMLDLMVLGFWSNTTRVTTFMFANAVSGRNFSFLDGVKGGHHEISHHKNDAEQLRQYARINQWHIEQYAYLLNKMNNIKEGNGTMLDNSMILFGAGMRDGNAHEPNNLPLVLAGKAGGTIKTGRYLHQKDPTPLANLYVGMLDRMGVDAKKFADADGELKGLKG
jgi:Protein of unknown function (DUF1552)